MVNKLPAVRTQLMTLLENWLESDEGEPLSPYIRTLFETAVRGLKDLDHGETPEVFKPVKSKRRGPRPAEVRRLELWACRHEATLVRNKLMSPAKARKAIAAAYGRSVDLLDDWQKNLKSEPSTTPDLGNELATSLSDDAWLERVDRTYAKAAPTANQILERARQHGERYRELRPGTKKGHTP